MHAAYNSKMPEIKLKLKCPNQLFEEKLLALYNSEFKIAVMHEKNKTF